MKVAIVTDSNSGITFEEASKLGVTVIPMPFLINDEEFFEELTLSQEDFYNKLLSGADVSTSQPNIYSVAEIWEKLLETYDEVVHIPMSSGLSASYETAFGYSKQFEGKVQVVDNKRISVTLKQSVIDAINLAKDGKNAIEIKNWLEESALDSSIYIMVTTLKYLKKGGRITPAAAALGSLLKIKPILQLQGKKLDKFFQVISYAQGKKKMLDQIVKDITIKFGHFLKDNKLKVSVAYTYDKDKALTFKDEINKELEKYNISVDFVDPLSLSVACHIGEGALAITCTRSYK